MADNLTIDALTLDDFFDAVVGAETRLYNAVSDRIQAAHGIGVGPFAFLRFIDRHPGCRVADLARAFAVGVGSVSKAVDRYVTQGWVRRDPNPSDRRSSLLATTEPGRELTAAAQATFHAALTELLADDYAATEITAAQAVLGRLRDTLEARDEGTPTG